MITVLDDNKLRKHDDNIWINITLMVLNPLPLCYRPTWSAMTVEGEGAVLHTIKPAEDGSGQVIVRLYECHGKKSKVKWVKVIFSTNSFFYVVFKSSFQQTPFLCFQHFFFFFILFRFVLLALYFFMFIFTFSRYHTMLLQLL